MTTVTLLQANHSPLLGAPPRVLYGEVAVDGDAAPFAQAPLGTLYLRKVSAYHTQLWQKVQDTNSDYDWRCVAGTIVETVLYSAFTDGGAAAGTYVLDSDIPAGAYVDNASVYVNTGFTGNTSAALTIGDGTDVDRYNTGTPSVLAAGWVDVGLRSGAPHHTAAMATVTLTVTGATDFTAISAGSLTVALHYRV